MRCQAQPQTLAQWLDLATQDPVPSAQVRIRTEIEAHYAEAVRGYLNSGQAEAEARAAALADLGEPRRAARRFGQTHLNRRDIRYLRTLPQTGLGYAMHYLLHGCFILICGWWAVKVITSPNASLWPDAVWSTLAFAAMAYPVLSATTFAWLDHREFNLANLRAKYWIFLISAITGWLFISLWISEMGMDSWFSWIFLVYIILSVPINILEWLNVRRKLLTATEEDLAEPPEHPSAA